MQGAENHLNARPALLRVHIHRHAAAVVTHCNSAIAMQNDVDARSMPGQRLVDTVVDNFLGQMVGASGVGVHAGALAHRLKPGEDFNIFRGVVAHAYL